MKGTNRERNLVFATNSHFLILTSSESNGVNLWCFRLRLIDPTKFIVWNIKSLDDIGFQKSGLENLSMWQKLSSFIEGFSLCNKLWFSNPLIFVTQRCCKPQIFLYSVRSNNSSLKYQRFTPSGYKDKVLRKAKTQLLHALFWILNL